MLSHLTFLAGRVDRKWALYVFLSTTALRIYYEAKYCAVFWEQ